MTNCLQWFPHGPFSLMINMMMYLLSQLNMVISSSLRWGQHRWKPLWWWTLDTIPNKSNFRLVSVHLHWYFISFYIIVHHFTIRRRLYISCTSSIFWPAGASEMIFWGQDPPILGDIFIAFDDIKQVGRLFYATVFLGVSGSHGRPGDFSG